MTAPDAAGTHGGNVFDPDLLSRCMSCGFCLPSCPTYRLTGEEASSPRGRITLMRAVQDGRLDVTDPTVLAQSQFCLGCRACEPVCPAGVQYGELLEEWRDTVWQGRDRPVLAKLLMLMMSRLGMAGIALAGRLRRAASAPRRAARTPRAASAPDVDRRLGAASVAGTPGAASAPETAGIPAVGTRKGAPQLMLGCVERVLYPRVSRAARRADPTLVAPHAQGCCGALHAHNGESARGRRMARRLGRQLPGTIVTTSGGCAAHLAAELGGDRVQEFSAWIAAGHGPDPADLKPVGVDAAGRLVDADRPGARRVRLGLQDSCHLRNALGVWREPRDLLARIGDYVEVPDAGSCCGAAGSYSVLRPEDSRRVLAPKLAAIAELDLDFLVVVNPGCYRQMAAGLRGTRTRAIHLAELLTHAL